MACTVHRRPSASKPIGWEAMHNPPHQRSHRYRMWTCAATYLTYIRPHTFMAVAEFSYKNCKNKTKLLSYIESKWNLESHNKSLSHMVWAAGWYCGNTEYCKSYRTHTPKFCILFFLSNRARILMGLWLIMFMRRNIHFLAFLCWLLCWGRHFIFNNPIIW